MKNPNDPIRNRTRDLPACSVPTASSRVPCHHRAQIKIRQQCRAASTVGCVYKKSIRPTLHTDCFLSKWFKKKSYTRNESMTTDSLIRSVLFLFQEQGCCGSRWWAPSCCGCRPLPAPRGPCSKDTVSHTAESDRNLAALREELNN